MDNQSEQSELVLAHQPCPDCNSTDALSVFSDGHTYCFACSTRKGGDNTQTAPKTQKALPGGLKQGEFREIKSRGLTLDTCKAFGYQVSNGTQIAQYTDAAGNIVAQKIRGKDKTFSWVGAPKGVEFYGKSIWRGCDKSELYVFEGEHDAHTGYQLTMGKKPCVSVQNGAQSAEKSFKQDLEWLESFASVVLCFDNDEAGIEAAKTCSALLTPGKAKIVELPLKDANDMLKEGRTVELFTALRCAKAFKPDGIVSGKALGVRARAKKPAPFAQYPWKFLNDAAGGIYEGDVIVVGAGSGIGKTTFFSEIAYGLAMSGTPVGCLFMEDSLEDVTRRFHGIYLNKSIYNGMCEVTDAELIEAEEATTDNGNFIVYEHQGEGDISTILSRMRYMIHALGARVIFLDNLSTLVTGLEDKDERRAIDKLMRGLYEFAQREKIAIFMASHLTRPIGAKGYENGLAISDNSFRGSGSISSNSTGMLGLERDKNLGTESIAAVRLIKSRKFGHNTGIRGHLRFTPETGRLTEDAGVSPFGEDKNTDF